MANYKFLMLDVAGRVAEFAIHSCETDEDALVYGAILGRPYPSTEVWNQTGLVGAVTGRVSRSRELQP